MVGSTPGKRESHIISRDINPLSLFKCPSGALLSFMDCVCLEPGMSMLGLGLFITFGRRVAEVYWVDSVQDSAFTEAVARKPGKLCFRSGRLALSKNTWGTGCCSSDVRVRRGVRARTQAVEIDTTVVSGSYVLTGRV